MRIINKMKKTMLVLAASLFCANATFAEVKTVNYIQNATENLPSTEQTVSYSLDGITFSYLVDSKWAVKESTQNFSGNTYTHYAGGGENPVVGEDGVPTKGSVMGFLPQFDGKLEVCVVVNGGKAIYIREDGVAINGVTNDGTAISEGTKLAEKLYGTIAFDVKAGKQYYLYCTGSKMGYYGFSYSYEEMDASASRFDLTAYNDTVAWVNEKKASLNAADEMEAEVIMALDEYLASAAAWLEEVEADPEATQADVDYIATDLKASVNAIVGRIEAQKLMVEVEAIRMEGDSIVNLYPEEIRVDSAGLIVALQNLPRNAMWATSEMIKEAIDAVKTAIPAFQKDNNQNLVNCGVKDLKDFIATLDASEETGTMAQIEAANTLGYLASDEVLAQVDATNYEQAMNYYQQAQQYLMMYKPAIEKEKAIMAATTATGEAEALMASYNNPSDEAGLAAAIAKVETILGELGMWDTEYTVADLNAAVEALAAAQEAFVAENAKDDMAVVKSWDFAAYCDTMTVSDAYMTYSDETVKVGGTASNLGTGFWEGLAMQGANKFWIRSATGGLYSGNGGGRKVGILDLIPGQKVTIVTNGECMALADTTNVELLSMQTADGKTTYEYAVTAEGMLALTMTRYFSIFSIVVEQPAAMLETAYWDFAAYCDTMTVSDAYMTYSDETVKVGGTASNLGTGFWEGLAMQGANKFWVRSATGGLYSGNGGGRKVGILDLKKASVVTIVTNGECMTLADATVAEQTSMETVDGKTTYVYTMVEDGTLALTMTRYFSIFSIKVEALVKYVSAPNWNFAAYCDTMTVSDAYMTYSDETVKVGGTASNLGTGFWEGLAMQGANKFWVRSATGGLYSGNGGGRKVGVLNMTAGSIVTIVTNGECMSLADATVAEQTSMETVDGKTTYVYTMIGDGTLALTMTRYYTIFSINVLAVQADIKAPTIDATKNTDDVVTVTLACETKDASIYYSIDGGADSLYNEPFQLAKTSMIKAYSVSADGKNTSKVTEKEVVAGFINAPTATITAVDGLNRTVTLASATEGASIVYGFSPEKVNATFEAPSNTNAIWNAETKSFTWTQGWYNQIRNIGLPTGDITKYAKLVIDCEIVAGTQFRILFYKGGDNKQLFITQSGITEIDIVEELKKLGDDYMSFLTECTEICLSGAGDNGEVKINGMYVMTATEELAYTEPFVISENKTVWATASKKSAIADTLTFTSATMEATLAAGTEVALNAPTFAKAVVDSLTQIEYAEKNLSAYMINSNQSSVLCAPTASIEYEFYPLNAETGRIAETASLSGQYTVGDTLFALPLGKLVAKTSAAGYASTEAYTWLKAPAQLTPIWEIDFDSLAVALASEGDVTPTQTDVVFNGNFRATSTSDFSNVVINDVVLPTGFALQTGTNWLLRNAADSYGLYNYNSGDRAFGFAGLKKNQVVKVSYQDAAQAIFVGGVMEQDIANSNGNDICYNVTADGNATVGMNRYYTIHKVGVYISSALTQTPDFAITKVDGETHYVGMTSGTLGADIYYAIGNEEYSESQVLVNDTTGGVEPVYETKIDTTVVYGEVKLYTEPVALDKTSYVRAYALYQDVESEAREQLIEAGFTVQIAQPVILYTGNTEAGEKQFTISVDNSEVISAPTTPIYYTLPGGEETLYDGGTITVKTDAYGWMTAVAKLAGYDDSKAARRYIDARESYTEKYEVVDADLETMPAEAGDVEVDYSEEMNVEQLGATAYAGRIYFHRTVDAAVINVSLPSVFNNNCYVTDAAGKQLERGVDYVIYEINAAERPIQSVNTGNMAATAAKGYVVNFLNAELVGKEVIFVSAVKGNIAKANFTYTQPAKGYKVVTNRMFAAATLDVPAYVMNAEGTAFELVETGAVVAPFQSVILASADICASVKSLNAEPDGIGSIATDGKEVKEIKYYTVGGVEVEKPAAGVYVQQIIFTDGTVKTVTVAGK